MALKSLALAHPDRITSADDVIRLLGCSQTFHEYATSLWSVIASHNDAVPIRRIKRICTTDDKENDPEVANDYHSQAWRREQQAISHIHNPEDKGRLTDRQRALREKKALKNLTNTT
jgi:hypothetical protein